MAVQTNSIPKKKRSPKQFRDDLLGKNRFSRSMDGNAPEGPFHGKPPYRKRTEDLDDSL